MDGQSGCGGDSTAIHTFCDMVCIPGMKSDCLSLTQLVHYFSFQGQSKRSAVALSLLGDLEKGLGNFIT